MEKYRDLLKNIFYLLISNFGTKILSFLLIPLYTSILSTSDYGNYDIINVTISLLIPILTISICDAPVRFLFDKNNNKKDVLLIGLKYTIIGNVIFITFLLINKIFNIIPLFDTYFAYIIFLYLVNSFYQLFSYYIKGMDQLKQLAISGFINSSLLIFLNLLFLLYFKIGIDGYFLANIFSLLVANLFLVSKIKIKDQKSNNIKVIEEEMIIYSRPMIFNSIGWWINNLSDRYIVTLICGTAANGIYSVAYKIPSILSSVQSIFNQAWTVSVIKNYESEDSQEYFNNIYSICNYLLIIMCSFIIIFTKEIAFILYKNDFYLAWKYTPFLLMSVIFGTLSGILGGIFTSYKKTNIISFTAMSGAVINIIFNIILVNFVGPIGAAISTLISYFFIFLMRCILVKKYISYKFKLIDFLCYFILIVQSTVILILGNYFICFIVELILFVFIILLNKKMINKIFQYIKQVVKKKKYNNRS